MPYKRIIVVTTYHLRVDDLWDIYEPLILEDSFDVLAALRKAPSSERFYFFVIVLQLGALLFFCYYLTAWGVVGSYFRCWRKDRLELCRFGESSRTDWAGEGYGFCIRGLGGEVTGLAQKMINLKSCRWSMRIASNTKSWRSPLGKSLSPQHSAEGIELRHWKLR